MTPSLETQLDRFADLIRRAGPEVLFAAPLVTPEDAWFPDRWSPDLESARRILLRLAEYAGLPDLEVEVASDSDETAETPLPTELIPKDASQRPVGVFYGFHDGRAWFAIEPEMLARPDRLVGVLAHEIAHVWREKRDIHVEPLLAEEECTDLTAIVLGFGILLCNTEYEYRATSKGPSYSRYFHSKMGYLELTDMTGLLACWARLKELPAADILRNLGPTQASDFREAWDQLEEIDVFDRVGISAVPSVEGPRRASKRDFTPSLASKDVHECVKKLVELAGDDGGLAPMAVPFPVALVALPNRVLATWGRIDWGQIWTRSLGLVADPEWDTQAVVIVAATGKEFRRVAVGHIRDRQARDAQKLYLWLARLFAKESAFRELVAPALPTFVTLIDPPKGFGDGHLEDLFRLIMEDADPDQVASETNWLRKYRGHTPTRLDLERAEGGIPLVKAAGPADTVRWWSVVSDAANVQDQLMGLPWFRSTRWDNAPKPTVDPASEAAASAREDGGA